MGKVSGSYDSLVLGVSEQVAHDRRSGQHWLQDNFLSDPVRGLCRRRGTVFQSAKQSALSTANAQAAMAEATGMRAYDFVIDGTSYVLLYRKSASTAGAATFAYLYNKTTDQFMPINYEASTWVTRLVTGGVSAIANMGAYLYVAGNTTIPTATQTNVWESSTNASKLAGWVRGGAYSRTFTLTLTPSSGSPVTVSYTTKASAYPELLDTSGIEFWADPPTNTTPREDYQKDINDAVYEYQSKVNAWIKEAAEDIVPANIATKLRDLLLAQSVAASVVGSTVVIDDADYVDISMDDGGDNSLVVAVGQEVAQATAVSRVHWAGKVVRVRPTGGSERDTYYMVAEATDPSATGWTEVVWREGAGILQTIDTMLTVGVIHNGQLHLARDGAGLTAMIPGTTHPSFKPSTVGDGGSNPLPHFVGRQITMLAPFQDRLLIGSGGTVNASRSGDYLQFFRQTILNVLDNDAVEMFAHGSEGDVLRHAVMYDRDLLLFGDLRQYGINGKQVLSAKAPNITTVSAHDRASVAPPIASGNYVFYGKNARRDNGELRTTLNQLQMGALTDTPVSYEVSQQLDTYIQGTPAQVLAMTSPSLVAMRTEERPNDVYIYNYVDSGNGAERLMDAWSRWEYNPLCGQLAGMSQHEGSVLLFWMREVADGVQLVADKQSLNGTLSELPYLDSAVRYDQLATSPWASVPENALHIAAGRPSPYFLLGTRLNWLDEMLEQIDPDPTHLWVGAISPAAVRPTNPRFRDQNRNVVMGGRLTLNSVQPQLADTAGLRAYVEDVNGERLALDFRGRVEGEPANLTDTQPHTDSNVSFTVGREVRDCTFTLRSVDWLPVTITALEWVGQYFNRVRRA